MKKVCVAWALIIGIIFCSSWNPITVLAKQSTQDMINEAKEEYEETKDKMDSAREDVDNLNEQKESLQSNLDDLNGKLQDVSDVLSELEACIAQKKNEIDETWGKIEDLALQIDEAENAAELQYDLTKAQIKYIYEQGDNMYSALLNSADSYADFINKNSYIEMMSEYSREQFDKLKETQQNLTSLRSEHEMELIKLEEEKTQLDEYEERVNEQRNRIETLINETTQKISSYSSQIESTEKKMLEYEKQMEEQEDNIENLEKRLEEERKTVKLAAESKWTDISDTVVSGSDRKLLANIIYCEAGNEPYVGKVAVGAVVMNRVRSSVFPNTIVGVIYQSKQFSPVASGRLALALAGDKADDECYRAADAALSGVTNVSDCLYFRTPTKSVSPRYTIGGHIFY